MPGACPNNLPLAFSVCRAFACRCFQHRQKLSPGTSTRTTPVRLASPEAIAQATVGLRPHSLVAELLRFNEVGLWTGRFQDWVVSA